MEALAAIISVITFSLLAGVALPSGIASLYVRKFARVLCGLLVIQSILALLAVVVYVAGGCQPQVIEPIERASAGGMGICLYYDGVSGLMLLLVSSIGFIVSRYSIRYLDGESSQGRYFKWLGFTVGAVSLLVISGNLLQFVMAWMLTSYGLHHLLLHYGHRPAARRAAWTKFAISRLGDAFLTVALILAFQTYGTVDFSQMFAQAGDLASSGQTTQAHAVIAWLLMLGAATKSAQFPFHIWLPETMETPTPVSALMHAGIVNAGGFLIVRLSPVVSLAPEALVTLALLGAFTACFAAAVMMTQSTIKRTLAYSTIAQMGFMMLQCGLGAFSAAMLHILAHSLYKAHAFLSSGSVLTQAAALRGASQRNLSVARNLVSLVAAAGVSVVIFLSVSSVSGLDIASKPGGTTLAMILCLSFTTLTWRLFTIGNQAAALYGLVGTGVLSLSYLGGYFAISYMMPASLPSTLPMNSFPLAGVGISLGFVLLFLLQIILRTRRNSDWINALRVHASNGFYVDAMYRRVVQSPANH